jgi:hypothetical protein
MNINTEYNTLMHALAMIMWQLGGSKLTTTSTCTRARKTLAIYKTMIPHLSYLILGKKPCYGEVEVDFPDVIMR